MSQEALSRLVAHVQFLLHARNIPMLHNISIITRLPILKSRLTATPNFSFFMIAYFVCVSLLLQITKIKNKMGLSLQKQLNNLY